MKGFKWGCEFLRWSVFKERKGLGDLGRYLLFFSMKCFLAAINREKALTSFTLSYILLEIVVSWKTCCVYWYHSSSFQLEEKKRLDKTVRKLISSHKRNVFENIHRSYNLTHCETQNSWCVTVCELKDSVVLEMAVKGGRSDPILITASSWQTWAGYCPSLPLWKLLRVWTGISTELGLTCMFFLEQIMLIAYYFKGPK